MSEQPGPTANAAAASISRSVITRGGYLTAPAEVVEGAVKPILFRIRGSNSMSLHFRNETSILVSVAYQYYAPDRCRGDPLLEVGWYNINPSDTVRFSTVTSL